MLDEEIEVKPWTHFYWDIFANTCWPFDEAEVVCGRSEGHFQYEDAELSSSHCQFSIVDGKCLLTDLESSNGTYLNMKEVVPSCPLELKCYDIIIFGRQIIIYFNEDIFKIKTREDLLAKLKKNVDNQDIYTEIKNKTILFMKGHHSRMIIKKKVQVLEAKIVDAYNIKEDKLSKYDAKLTKYDEQIKLVNEKLKEIKALKEKLEQEKESLTAKIDPQIDKLIEQKESFEDEYENLSDLTNA